MIPRIIGMVHLGPLPGAPRFDGDLDGLLAAAAADAASLAGAGFDAVMIENYNDVPFFPDTAPPVTISAMTRAALAVADAIEIPFGVNVLRNDAAGALAVASVTGASFIRVNVLSGLMYTDQGPITGRAAEVARARKRIAPEVKILADVFVKHGTPPPGTTIEQAAEDLVARALADAVIVSGRATGSPPASTVLELVRDAIGDAPLFLGSGASESNVADMLAFADGVIAGTSVKEGGITTNPVDPDRAARFVTEARRALN